MVIWFWQRHYFHGANGKRKWNTFFERGLMIWNTAVNTISIPRSFHRLARTHSMHNKDYWENINNVNPFHIPHWNRYPPFSVHTLSHNFPYSNSPLHMEFWTSWLLHLFFNPPPWAINESHSCFTSQSWLCTAARWIRVWYRILKKIYYQHLWTNLLYRALWIFRKCRKVID